jgi:hypothetical protein
MQLTLFSSNNVKKSFVHSAMESAMETTSSTTGGGRGGRGETVVSASGDAVEAVAPLKVCRD